MVEIAPATIAFASALISGGVAFGVIKGSMGSYVKHEQHRILCRDNTADINKKIDRIEDMQLKIFGMVQKIHGRLENINMDDTNC